jgi:hypothetical protein
MIAATSWHPELPSVVRSGEYEARLVTDHNMECVVLWHIFRHETLVGDLRCDLYYSRTVGKLRWSLNHLVWSGPFARGYPKNPDGALVFDGGPLPANDWQKALDRFAAQADALIAWRERNSK